MTWGWVVIGFCWVACLAIVGYLLWLTLVRKDFDE